MTSSLAPSSSSSSSARRARPSPAVAASAPRPRRQLSLPPQKPRRPSAGEAHVRRLIAEVREDAARRVDRAKRADETAREALAELVAAARDVFDDLAEELGRVAAEERGDDGDDAAGTATKTVDADGYTADAEDV